MVFQNRIDQLESFDKQHTALNMLKTFMILKSITAIEHDDFLVGGTIFDGDPDLEMFWYKEQQKSFSHENLKNDIKKQVSKGVLIN